MVTSPKLKIKMPRQRHGDLITLPIIFVIAMGMIVNSINWTPTTPWRPNSDPLSPYNMFPNCQANGNGGVFPNGTLIHCNESAFSVTRFLNIHSPFTALISGDLWGFIKGLFSAGGSNSFTRTEFDLTTQTLISVVCLDANNVQVQDAIALAAIGGFASGGVGLFLLAHPNAYLKVCSIPTGWTYSTTGNSIIFMCNGDFHVDISCNPMRIDGWWTLGSFSGQPPSTLFECTSTHPITQPDGTTKYELLAFTPTMVCGAVGTQQPTEGAVLSFVFTLFGLSASFMLILIALGINIGGTAGIPIIGQFTATFGSNPQGTKLAQVFGVGLLFWTIINSEFGTWGSIFPFGFGFILQFIVMPTMFFYGLWERATSGGATFS